MATGWLLSMFVPTRIDARVNQFSIYAITVRRTFENNTKGALSNLLANPEVIANDAIGSGRLGMVT